MRAEMPIPHGPAPLGPKEACIPSEIGSVICQLHARCWRRSCDTPRSVMSRLSQAASLAGWTLPLGRVPFTDCERKLGGQGSSADLNFPWADDPTEADDWVVSRWLPPTAAFLFDYFAAALRLTSATQFRTTLSCVTGGAAPPDLTMTKRCPSAVTS